MGLGPEALSEMKQTNLLSGQVHDDERSKIPLLLRLLMKKWLKNWSLLKSNIGNKHLLTMKALQGKARNSYELLFCNKHAFLKISLHLLIRKLNLAKG